MTSLGTRLADGDSRAVEDCYKALRPRVLSYLRRLMPACSAAAAPDQPPGRGSMTPS
jgi:DNA-directed RNA polymerase specialized sigma24 family protein